MNDYQLKRCRGWGINKFADVRALRCLALAEIAFISEIVNFRGHRDIRMSASAFQNPPITIEPFTLVWASATEMDASGQYPETSGAYITVMQVTPVPNSGGPGEIVAHVLVDNVPNNINIRITFFVAL